MFRGPGPSSSWQVSPQEQQAEPPKVSVVIISRCACEQLFHARPGERERESEREREGRNQNNIGNATEGEHKKKRAQQRA